MNMKENIFPIEVFNPDLQETIRNVSEDNQVSIDIIGTFMINVIGYSLLNKYEIRVKPHWVERSNTFVLFIGYSGTGKTPLFNALTLPVRKLDIEMKKIYNLKLAHHIKYKNAKKKGGALHEETDPKKIIEWWGKENPGTNWTEEVPQEMDAYVETVTFEALHQILSTKRNDGRSLLIRYDEFAGFMHGLNQYRRGSDEEVFLKLFGYTGMKKNNVGEESSGIIEDQNVCIAGTTQPDALFDIITKERIKNGAAFRFLFCFDSYEDSTPKNVFDNWDENLDHLVGYRKMIDSFLEGYETPVGQRIQLEYTSEQKKFIREWRTKYNRLIKDDEMGLTAQEHVGIGGKADSLIFRLAIILNRTRKYYENANDEIDLDLEDFKNAEKLLKYYIHNVQRVIGGTQFTKSRFFKAGEEEFYDSLPSNFDNSEFIQNYTSLLNSTPRTAQRRLKLWVQEYKIIFKSKTGYYKKD